MATIGTSATYSDVGLTSEMRFITAIVPTMHFFLRGYFTENLLHSLEDVQQRAAGRMTNNGETYQ
jgi:hypothetical protein